MSDRGHVLVVEDDIIIQEVLAQILADAGHGQERCYSCEEARKVFAPGAFSCALVDLGLPDGNGLDLLPQFIADDPWLVPIILTGDTRPESIVETMRAGAFDYITKPVESAQLIAAVSKAVAHHHALRERDEAFQLLKAEREQLKQRVEEATADIREYALHCETISARLQSLLRLTQMSEHLSTDEALFIAVFEEMGKFLPLRCVALCGADTGEFLAATHPGEGEVTVITSDTPALDSESDVLPNRQQLRGAVLDALVRFTDLPVREYEAFDHPQSFWGRPVGTVVFFTEPGFEPDEHLTAFLSMCAHFIAYERQESQLFLHATKQASVGNIAMELSKALIQGLTAVGTTAEYMNEIGLPEEADEGLGIIRDTVNGMQRQLRDFRGLSSLRRDAIETVHLDEYIDQALELLSMAIESRNIEVVKDYQTNLDCVLLNGSTLARTFLDLIASAVRTAEASGQVLLRLTEADKGFVSFEISHDGKYADVFGRGLPTPGQTMGELMERTPTFLLAQRTIQSCGGRLYLDQERASKRGFRILLPRNAATGDRIVDVVNRDRSI